MKITLLTVGKLKEPYWKDALSEYQKRLSRFADLSLVEVADEKTPDGAGPALEERIKETEGERLLARIPSGAYVITLEIQGKALSSPELAQTLQSLALRGHSHFCFVIGGSLGLSQAVCQRADLALSFSRLTFPHQLMRIILLEQLYRAFKINAGEPYHK